jgi:hypothetical protein
MVEALPKDSIGEGLLVLRLLRGRIMLSGVSASLSLFDGLNGPQLFKKFAHGEQRAAVKGYGSGERISTVTAESSD